MAVWIQLINRRNTARPAHSMSGNKIPKHEAAKSFFSIAMLQMRNDQRTDAISETAVFIKFQWIHIDMKTNFIKEQSCKETRKTASRIAS